MYKKCIKFPKQKFHQHKRPISIKNVDIDKIVVSNKVSFHQKGFKYFNDYKDNEKIKPLCIFLPKTIEYRKKFNETKYISFLIKDSELLEKYNEIWDKVSYSIRKEFDTNPVYDEKYLKAKTKSHSGKSSTNFHDNKMPKEGSKLVCLSVILIDSVFRTGSTCSPQVFLEECKCC